ARLCAFALGDFLRNKHLPQLQAQNILCVLWRTRAAYNAFATQHALFARKSSNSASTTRWKLCRMPVLRAAWNIIFIAIVWRGKPCEWMRRVSHEHGIARLAQLIGPRTLRGTDSSTWAITCVETTALIWKSS